MSMQESGISMFLTLYVYLQTELMRGNKAQ